MKNALTLIGFWLALLPSMASGQCTLANYTTMTLIGPGSFPYYAPSPGITVTASAPGVPTLGNFSYPCNGQSFTCTSPSWWLNSATQVITLGFSCPIAKFSVVINGTNLGEVITFTGNSGTTTLSDYCTSFSTVLPNQLIDNITPATGTLITVNNPSGATSYQITHNGVGSGSRISVLDCFVCATPFAATMTAFDAVYRPDLGDVMLHWETSMEPNSNGFEVQHSLDGEIWDVLGLVPSEGNEQHGANYGFPHLKPVQGMNYYRLRQVDQNADYHFSEIKTVNLSTDAAEALIFPNPATGRFEVRAAGRKGSLEITDMLGRHVRTHRFDSQLELDMSGDARGIYQIKITDQRNATTTQRLVLQ